MKILTKFSVRHILARPTRAALTLSSIVLGVALVVAVSVATSTTRSAYYEMFSAVTGKTALEVVATGGGTFDAKTLATVEKVPGVKAAAPVLQRKTIMYVEADGKDHPVQVTWLGIDPARDQAIRQYTLAAGRMILPGEAGIVLDVEFARSLGLEVGSSAKLLTRESYKPVVVVGLLSLKGAESVRMAGVIFLPLDRSQLWFRARGQIESIQIVLDDQADEAAVSGRLAAALPEHLVARRPAVRTQVMDETMNASQQALRWTMVITVLLSAFIILNTFLMSIGERRQQLAVMRCVGATRGQIARMIISESLVLGVVGTLLGVALGLVGALGLSNGMSQLMQIAQPSMVINWVPFALAFAIGPVLAIIGAIAPASIASRYSPLEGMRPLSQSTQKGIAWQVTATGIALVLGSCAVLAVCVAGWLPTDVSLGAAVTLMIGFVVLVPEFLVGLGQLLFWCLWPFLGSQARLAHRQVLRHRVRSALTIGVLFVASSSGLGMANAILDSVDDVQAWYERTLAGDYFIRAMMPDMTGGASADIPDAMIQEAAAVPGILRFDTVKFFQADAAGQQVVVIVRDFKRDQRLYIDVRDADRDVARDQLFEGGVIIGTVLAQKTNLKRGDKIPIETRQGTKNFEIAALTNEYLVGGLVIYMERGTAAKSFNISGVDGLVIKAEPNKLEEVQAKLQPLCEKYGVILHSFADIARMIDGMIRGINVGLWGTIVACYAVAAIGVVNTLTMNVLEQTRELGLLRIVAMTRRQVRVTLFAQAGMIGLIGLGPGTVLGFIVAYVMHMLMLASIGHPVPFVFRPALYGSTFVFGLVIVMLAAWLPAERAARLELPEALKYE